MSERPVLRPRGDGLLQGRFRAELERALPAERRLRLPVQVVDRAAALLVGEGGRLVSVTVVEAPERSLEAVLAFRGELVDLRAPLPDEAPTYPSLALALPAALLPERELRDRFGVEPLGHPDADPVLRPDADALRRRVAGPEAFAIPYGPVRSGVFEAIQYVVESGGEDVLALETRTFFKHRALEERFAGLPLDHGARLAERVAGIAGVAHATAFAQAVERATGVEPPLRAQLWRVVHAELERIANHLDVAAKLAEDAALSVGLARLTILKEDVLRLRAAASGSRFGRGVVVPGGVTADALLPPWTIARDLDALERELRRDRRLLLRTTSFVDRLIGSGRLDRDTVEAHGGVGPVARATGISTDARFERPFGAYARLGFELGSSLGGDAMARLEVRLAEIGQSLHLVRQALDRIERTGPELAAPVPAGASGRAFGWTEAPQGELVYDVALADGRVAWTRIASPSLRNWPLFAASFRGDVLTDVSFIEHSFGLTPAGADR